MAELPVKFEGACPILVVTDLAKSLEYYVDVLGFRIDWNYEETIAAVARDRCCIFLSQDRQGHRGGWAWIGVSDSAALHDELVSRGARIRMPPTNFTWALEMHVEDLDGNVLRMGSEPLEGEPLGVWVDARGEKWREVAEQEWEKVE